MAKAIPSSRYRQEPASRADAVSLPLPLQDRRDLALQTAYSVVAGWSFNQFAEQFWSFEGPDALLVYGLETVCGAADSLETPSNPLFPGDRRSAGSCAQ